MKHIHLTTCYSIPRKSFHANSQTKAKMENQRTLDMFVMSKNIINDTGKSNKYDNHYVNVNYVYLHSDESHFCSQTWHHCCCFPEFAVTMHLNQHLKL